VNLHVRELVIVEARAPELAVVVFEAWRQIGFLGSA